MIQVLIALWTFMTGISYTGPMCNFYIQDTMYNTGWLQISPQATRTCDAAGIVFNDRYWTAWSQQPSYSDNAQPWIASLLVNKGPETLVDEPLEPSPDIVTWNLQHPRFMIQKQPAGWNLLILCYESVGDANTELCWYNYQNPDDWWTYMGKFDRRVYLPSVR